MPIKNIFESLQEAKKGIENLSVAELKREQESNAEGRGELHADERTRDPGSSPGGIVLKRGLRGGR